MDTQNYIEYELVNPATGNVIMTDSRDEAVAYFEKDWMVYEHHVTISQHSAFTQSQLTVTMMWNGNSEIQEV